MKNGLEVLMRQRAGTLRGKRVGLITHPAAVLPDLTPTLDALLFAGVRIAALFGMEHGLAGAAADGAVVGHAVYPGTGIPVHSLYGPTLEPEPAMLEGLDVLVYDVQDVGVRFYTFISTLFYVLRSSGRTGLPVVVLDRPNPINGQAIEGPTIDEGHESFVGIISIPIRHGMTVGELAQYMNAEHRLGAGLTVVEMEGWRRAAWFDELGSAWVPTSPGIPHFSTAVVYPGICLLEGTNLSLGRGTALPFEHFGAPWVEGRAVADVLNGKVSGVRFRPTSFEPAADKWAGQLCHGCQVYVTDREALRPVRMGLAVLAALRGLYSDRLRWETAHFDRLVGGTSVREALDGGVPPDQIADSWQPAEETFRDRRGPYLLY